MPIPARIPNLDICPMLNVSLPERIFRIVFPFLLGGCYFGVCLLFLPRDMALVLGGLMLAYVIPPAGKESVIPIGIAIGFPWWLMTFSIALIDVLAGIFMALNCDMALKIPVLGRWIQHFMDKGGEFINKRPWLERFYFTGVVLFVMFPLQGSGGVGGTLVGRMIGLSPGRTLLAITLGAFTGCAFIGLGAEVIKDLILMNLEIGIAVLVIVLATLATGYLLYRRRLGR
ncbi:MAG: small multi-drug export protein [Methanolinea sp.]|jgi:uncharacterized membrane protein|nr:small multi-drug export protein [Methanolinea sp.]